MINMIDEYWTWIFYGYHSDELKPQSQKLIVAVCDECSKYRVLHKSHYKDLCGSCAAKKRPPMSIETRNKISISNAGKILTEEHRNKMSKPRKPFTKEACHNMSIGAIGRKMPPRSEEHCQHISAGRQGIPYEEWTGNINNGEYCELFDDACRERIREKYDHRCFICDKPQCENLTKNGRVWKLAVHHVDRNRYQGCNGVKWNLIPVCLKCHGMTHSELWEARIEYLLAHQEELYRHTCSRITNP